ncbi:YfjL-like protein [Aedoeadaptatus pacaensis]|uniref:YfjL-like protein n=1 Tax=Aedoeadaptatus pacaensis TaxID=1776390 RepID=UPI000837B1FA|nr:hypothetical protein [Peptoniphilus pacaensis]
MKLSVKKIALGIFVLLVLAVVNTLFGNPMSKALAEHGADKVIAEKYGDLDLSREKVFYNFKAPEYVVHLQDKNSEDSQFELCFDSFGRLRRDTYDWRIDNTAARFESAVWKYGEVLEKKYDFPYEISLSAWNKIDEADYLTLDQPVDLKHLPYKLEVQTFGERKITADEAMAILKRLQQIMDDENLDVMEYALTFEPKGSRDENGALKNKDDMFSVYEVPADVVRRGDVDALKALAKEQMTEGKD